MIMKFLSESGLTYFLNKLKSLFVTKTDFNKVCNDGIIDVKQVVNKTNTNGANLDLTLGDKEDLYDNESPSVGSYITICNQGEKNGNIYINGTSKGGAPSPSIYLTSDSDIHLSAHGNDSTIDMSAGIALKSNNATSITAPFKVFRNDNFNLSVDDSFIVCSLDNRYQYINVEDKTASSDSTNKVQFLVDKTGDTISSALDIRPTKIKIWSDTMQLTKDKEIRFRTSTSNSMRLTEGQGFKVFANMYAMPDHATDINDFTADEQALLTNNTVQKLLLKLNKNSVTINDTNNTIKGQWMPPIVAQTIAVDFDTDYIILTNFSDTDKIYDLSIRANDNIKVRIIDVYVYDTGAVSIRIINNETDINYTTIKKMMKGRYRISSSTETNKVYIEQLS